MYVGERGREISFGEGDIMQNKALKIVKEKASNVSLVFFKWMQKPF
jgi:L-ribulose-5-phosphate 3-epimerase UlaE